MRKRLYKHLAAWAAWYLLNSLSLFQITLTSSQWAQLAYNYISLVLVFYAVAGFSYRYFSGISSVAMDKRSGISKACYLLFRWQVLGVVAVMVIYITCSIYLDNRFFGYQYESLQAHIDQRFIRQLSYVFAAGSWSYYRWVQRRNQIRLDSLKARVVDLQGHVLTKKQSQRAMEELKQEIAAGR